jgi:hypothetical protein
MNLKDAFDQDKFVIDDNEYTDEDFEAMSFDDLETIKMRINKKISGISASIKEKQIEYSNGGKGTSKSWYMSRRSALSINQRVLTYVNCLIKKRFRSERKISDYFMKSAKNVLPRGEFENILSKAYLEMGNMEEENEKDKFNA